ncbi:FkbM family methyltransferase [Desertivirga brevis]|uniref:FkbM family methyltransferase n=1 Tax=Desertivirga brevis TaxID=2810310 RepID=UPI001A96A5B7|nr:FkbM family methyltransferase [Pedobacter sp. SYSU D00873]
MIHFAKSPVLFLIFNRPEQTKLVFDRIREAKPTKLYIAADGPRPERNELDSCKATRDIVKHIDWQCEVKTLFREENLGCKEAVSSAIDWFFQNEEEGIILEDDCLPSNDFFRFCDTLLEKYRFDSRIRHISGCNLQHGRFRGDHTYYFSNMTHVWGWASWRRVWKDYDKNLSNYEDHEVFSRFIAIFREPLIAESWTNIFKMVKAGEIDTWDYQLTLINFFNHSLSIIPNYNLITNIGFGENATHTFTTDDPNARIPLSSLPEQILDPRYFLPQIEADYYTLNLDFDLEARKERILKEAAKRKGWIKRAKYKFKKWRKRNKKTERDKIEDFYLQVNPSIKDLKLTSQLPNELQLQQEIETHRNVSYSQEGEDAVLGRIFEFQPSGFFVDIGAHHPLRFSNTYKFYEKGWRGINIDAMPGSMDSFKKFRPRDINQEIPVSDKEESIPFYIFNEPALNTFSNSMAEERNGKEHYRIEQTVELKTKTLENILNEYLPENQEIDFLSIDAEGFDVNVIKSNNWTKYRPKIVLIENEVNLNNVDKSSIHQLMIQYNYELYAKTVKTYLYKEKNFEI